MTDRLDADQLLRALADAWRSAGRSKDFPWDADIALQSSLRRLTSDVGNGVGVVAYSQIGKIGAVGIALILLGGLFYTVGAVVYARRRPDPFPSVLGYHELFHICTIAAAACHWAAIAFFVLPRA